MLAEVSNAYHAVILVGWSVIGFVLGLCVANVAYRIGIMKGLKMADEIIKKVFAGINTPARKDKQCSQK